MADARKAAGVVIIGGGHAGGRTAERLRHCGYAGPIQVVGMERELPYERPPLSKAMLTAAEAPSNSYILPQPRWNELGVRFRLGTAVTAIHRDARAVSLSDGSRIGYHKLVIATGVTPRRLPILDRVEDRVVYLRSFEDALALRRRILPGSTLLLIGAGFIGLEVAASAARLGAAVTIVEAAERPLSRLLPPAFSDWLSAVHRRAGVVIRCGRQLASAQPARGGAAIMLDDGTRLEAGLILVGAGCTPNDGLATSAGLDVEDGIIVDGFAQTNDPSIFAVGDVARHDNPLFRRRWRIESWKNAEDMAAVAAACICGNPAAYCEVPWFWTDQYDLNIQIAGVPGTGDPAFERGRPGERGYLAYFAEADRLTGAIGVGCGRDIRIAREAIRAGGRVDRADLARRGFVAFSEAPLERQAS